MSRVSDSTLGIEESRDYDDKEMREERREKREERREKREEKRESELAHVNARKHGFAFCFVFPSSRSARALGLAQAAEGKIRNKIFSHLFSLFSF